MTFDEAIAADTLGLILPESLPQFATEALASGLDSNALATFAGEPIACTTPAELHALFARALAELGITRPSPLAAATTLATYYARMVLGGQRTPRSGVMAITRIVEALPSEQRNAGRLHLGKLADLNLEYEVLETEGYGSASELDPTSVEHFERILGAPAA